VAFTAALLVDPLSNLTGGVAPFGTLTTPLAAHSLLAGTVAVIVVVAWHVRHLIWYRAYARACAVQESMLGKQGFPHRGGEQC
jgi:hypothetical protein